MIPEGNCMLIRKNIKAVSTLAIILLMIVSAIIGGLLSYMFTISFFTRIPGKTTVAITNVYFDRENARSFKISVLNPSYSPTSATVTRIALSLNGKSQLYDVVETEPSIEKGIVIPKGEALNITCLKAQKDGADVSWGRLAGEFAGENITVHVFSPDSPAANIEAPVPFVKLHVTDTDFDSKVSLNRFNITIMNDVNSEINLTINEIMVGGVDLDGISPRLPRVISGGESVHFNCTGSWRNLIKTTLSVSTEEGYIFSQELGLPKVTTTIQNVIFNENYTDHFNVTVFNSADSANYVNVTKIKCTLENGATIQRNYTSVGITPNSTWTFMFNWTWKQYRGKEINVIAYLLQGFKTDTFTKTTPPPVILSVLNEKEVFDLKHKEHFNITLENHPSSIEAVNITKIVVKGEVINGTKANPNLPYGPIEPGQNRTFYCNITNWTLNWIEHASRNLTLTIHAINQTLEEYTFNFTFTLPMAELNVTSVSHAVICETKYLNVTIENLNCSVWNLTISKVIITLSGQTEPLEQQFPENQIIAQPGDNAVLLCVFDWKEYLGKNITVTVITKEGVEASWQGMGW